MRGLSLTRLPGNSGVMSLTRQNYAGPLDAVPGAAAAYSTRRLRFGYTGPAVRVRRSLDNAEADIGFDGAGNLDQSALRSFVGSQNLLQHSEAFDNAYWAKSASSVTATNIVSPTGTSDAERINFPSGGLIALNLSGWTAGTIATLSVWVRRASSGSASHFRITSNNAALWNTGQATKVLLTNEWQRVSLSGNLVTSGTSLGVRFGSRDIAGVEDPDCVGNVEMWGAQLNLGNLQPYSPTTSVARDGNGFVTTWYDQSDNARHVTQATAANQPQIMTNGILNTRNGRTEINFNGSTQWLSLATQLSVTDVTINAVAATTISGRSGVLYLRNSTIPDVINAFEFNLSAANRANFFSRNNGDDRADAVYTVGTLTVLTGISRGIETNIFNAGVQGTTGVNAKTEQALRSYFVTIGASNSGANAVGNNVFHAGGISSITIFPSALSTADRQALERNQGTYYGVTVA